MNRGARFHREGFTLLQARSVLRKGRRPGTRGRAREKNETGPLRVGGLGNEDSRPAGPSEKVGQGNSRGGALAEKERAVATPFPARRGGFWKKMKRRTRTTSSPLSTEGELWTFPWPGRMGPRTPIVRYRESSWKTRSCQGRAAPARRRWSSRNFRLFQWRRAGAVPRRPTRKWRLSQERRGRFSPALLPRSPLSARLAPLQLPKRSTNSLKELHPRPILSQISMSPPPSKVSRIPRRKLGTRKASSVAPRPPSRCRAARPQVDPPLLQPPLLFLLLSARPPPLHFSSRRPR